MNNKIRLKIMVFLVITFFIINQVVALTFNDFEAYAGQITEVIVTNEPGGLSNSDFMIKINDDLIKEFSVVNTTSTNYKILFRAPIINGSFDINITADSESSKQRINISYPTLSIKYSNNLNLMSNLGYNTSPGIYTVGLACAKPLSITSNQLTSLIGEKPTYILLTSPSTTLSKANKLLRKQKFSKQITSSFGYPILSNYFIAVQLIYPDVELLGEEDFKLGKQNLKLESIQGNAPKTVTITTMESESPELITVSD